MRYTLVGHVTKDIAPTAPEGFLWGGTVTYSGRVVAQLGAEVSILTTGEESANLRALDPRLNWHISESPVTTTFENIYDAVGNRQQTCPLRAKNINLNDFPDLEPAPDIIHLSPLTNEISLETIQAFAEKYPDSWLVATPQGWMRAFDEQNHVQHINWPDAEAMLPYFKAVVFSQEDINNQEDLARSYSQKTGIPVIYTSGIDGAIIFHGEEKIVVNAMPSQVVDPTGAGDIIAAAFFIRYFETGDLLDAVFYGTAAASIGIEHVGATGLPTRSAIEERLSQWDSSQRIRS